MKNSFGLVFVILIGIVLGCTCQNTRSFEPSENTKTNSKTPDNAAKNTSESKSDEDDIFSENKSEKKTDDSEKSSEKSVEDSPKSNKTNVFDEADESGGRIPTLAQFNRIKPGMTYDEVVGIVGFEGKLIKQSGDSSRYIWGDDNSFIMISFENERVFLATQNNLK